MNLVKTIEQYDDLFTYYCDPIKNNIMNNGYFIRIIYSNSLFSLNGINLLISFNELIYEKYYNKYKCNFNILEHNKMIESIKSIECNLLKNANIVNKHPQNKIYEQLKSGYIKIFADNIENINNNLFMLKISGIWVTETQYGLTYKFLKINHQ